MRRTVVSVFDGDVFHRSQTAQALGRLSMRLTTRIRHYCIVDTTIAHSTVRNDLKRDELSSMVMLRRTVRW